MQTASVQAAHLSKQQERLWKWWQANQAKSIQAMLQLEGSFEPGRFQQALQQEIARYEILRTTFVVLPNTDFPVQLVGYPNMFSYPSINLQGLAVPTQQHMLSSLWHDFQRRCFDLQRGPLLEVLLLQVQEQQHVLMLRLCALCADASTLKHLLAEVLQGYRGLEQEEGKVQQEEPLQYIDVSSWLQELQTSEEATQHQQFWRTFALAERVSLPLPFHNRSSRRQPVPEEGKQSGTSLQQVPIVLNGDWQKRLLELSQRTQVSIEVCVLTCWQILLWRLSGVVPLIGVACDGRPHEELANVVGPYARNVPFSLNLDSTISFEQALIETSLALQQVRALQLYFNWEALVPGMGQKEWIFPIGFSYEDRLACWQAGSLFMRLLEQESWNEPAHLHLQVTQVNDQLQLQLLYQPAAFSQREAQYLAGLLETLSQQVLIHPQKLLSQLPLLTQEQQVQLQESLRGPQRHWPFVPLHHLFESQVRQRPHAPALRSGDVLLSYQQLDQHANQLAHLLLAQGLLPGNRVALCLPGDHQAIISLLAVLKAGCTYTPLDMSQPTARLHLLLDALCPALLLSSQIVQDRLPATSTPLLLVEALSQQLSVLPCSPPHVEVAADDLAYIMTTSGSTGQPKAVLIRHQSVSNYTLALCDLLQLQPGWHFALVSSLAADLGNTSIFCSLASGGCLHLLTYELTIDANSLSAYLREQPIDVLKIVPSHLQALLSADVPGVLPRQRLILGGEALPWSLLEQVRQLQPDCLLYNHYGPTEATIGTLVHPLGPAGQVLISHEPDGDSVPIGLPLANTRAYLLDASQHLVPVGVPGELYIGGDGLAAGYLQEREQTAERFVPDPFGPIPGARLYRTGDLARYRSDGTIEFLGREDGQVKLRGYRIEPGEIEAQLRSLPQVREAVVQLRTEEGREPSLLGYIVAWQSSGPDPQQLQEALRERLPEYMVPSQILLLERLPLTANGKVDRQRLLATKSASAFEPGHVPTPANTPIEKVILQIWQEVLNLPSIGTNDNFFRLGGHSLLATQVIARIRRELKVELGVQVLFEAPMIAQLAVRIEQEQALRIAQTEADELSQMLAALEELSDDDVRSTLAPEM